MGAKGSRVREPFDQFTTWPKERALGTVDEYKFKDYDFGIDAANAAMLLRVDLKTGEKVATLLSRKGEPTGIINALSLVAGVILLNESFTSSEAAGAVFDVFDFDNSGEISMDEMTILMLSACRGLKSMLAVGRDPHDDDMERSTMGAFDQLGKTYGTYISRVDFLKWTRVHFKGDSSALAVMNRFNLLDGAAPRPAAEWHSPERQNAEQAQAEIARQMAELEAEAVTEAREAVAKAAAGLRAAAAAEDEEMEQLRLEAEAVEQARQEAVEAAAKAAEEEAERQRVEEEEALAAKLAEEEARRLEEEIAARAAADAAAAAAAKEKAEAAAKEAAWKSKQRREEEEALAAALQRQLEEATAAAAKELEEEEAAAEALAAEERAEEATPCGDDGEEEKEQQNAATILQNKQRQKLAKAKVAAKKEELLSFAGMDVDSFKTVVAEYNAKKDKGMSDAELLVALKNSVGVAATVPAPPAVQVAPALAAKASDPAELNFAGLDLAGFKTVVAEYNAKKDELDDVALLVALKNSVGVAASAPAKGGDELGFAGLDLASFQTVVAEYNAKKDELGDVALLVALKAAVGVVSTAPAEGPASSEELSLWRMIFEKLDRDHSGSVERIEVTQTLRDPELDPEFAALLHSELGLPDHVRREDGTRDLFDAIWNKMDMNRDQSVSFEEFTAFVRKVKKGGLADVEREGATTWESAPVVDERTGKGEESTRRRTSLVGGLGVEETGEEEEEEEEEGKEDEEEGILPGRPATAEEVQKLATGFTGEAVEAALERAPSSQGARPTAPEEPPMEPPMEPEDEPGPTAPSYETLQSNAVDESYETIESRPDEPPSPPVASPPDSRGDLAPEEPDFPPEEPDEPPDEPPEEPDEPPDEPPEEPDEPPPSPPMDEETPLEGTEATALEKQADADLAVLNSILAGST